MLGQMVVRLRCSLLVCGLYLLTLWTIVSAEQGGGEGVLSLSSGTARHSLLPVTRHLLLQMPLKVATRSDHVMVAMMAATACAIASRTPTPLLQFALKNVSLP